MSASLSVWLEGVSLLAPGMADWAAGAPVLRGERAYEPAATVLPVPALLPAAERRRASRVVKLCLELGLQACGAAQRDAKDLPSVFCASNGDGHTLHNICETLAGPDRLISPTRFHNSVHNAPSGYWSIATGSMQASQVLCAFDATFSVGLLEAAVQAHADAQPVLLLAYDSEYPEPLLGCRPIPDAAGIGMVLNHERSQRAIAQLRIALSPGAGNGEDTASLRAAGPAPAMDDMTLAALARFIPALAGLPLLRAIAMGDGAPVELPRLPGQAIRVEVLPC